MCMQAAVIDHTIDISTSCHIVILIHIVLSASWDMHLLPGSTSCAGTWPRISFSRSAASNIDCIVDINIMAMDRGSVTELVQAFLELFWYLVIFMNSSCSFPFRHPDP